MFLGFARAVRTWKMVHYSPASCIWQPFLGVWVLLVEYGTLDSSGDDSVRGAKLGLTVDTWLVQYLAFGRISHIFYVDVGPNFGVFSPAEWRSMLSRCFDLSPCTRCSPLEYRHYFYESVCWILRDDVGHFSRSARIFRTPPLGVESPVVMPINPQRLLTKTLCPKARVKKKKQQQPQQQQHSVATVAQVASTTGQGFRWAWGLCLWF